MGRHLLLEQGKQNKNYVFRLLLGVAIIEILSFLYRCWWFVQKSQTTTWDVQILANHGINYQLVIAGFLNHEKYHEITGDPLKTRSNAAPYGDTTGEYLSLHMYMYMYNIIRLDPTYLCIIIYEICIFALES